MTASAAASDSGLSTGAKAGIGVGVAIGAIALAAIAGAFLFRRRKRRSQGEADPEELGGRTSPPPFQSMAELEEQQGPAELAHATPSAAVFKGKYAAVAPESPHELPAGYPDSVIAELPAVVDERNKEDRLES